MRSWSLGVSSGACTERSIFDIIPALQRSGAAGIEVGTPPRHFDPWQPDQVTTLAERLTAAGLTAVSIHAPFGGLLDLADPNPHHRHAAVGAILTAADGIKRLGGRLVVVHPSDIPRNGHDVQARLENIGSCLALLADNCRQEALTLVIESPLPHLIGGHPDEFAWLLRRVGDSARVCLDTGHTALGRNWHRFLEVADSRVIHVHAHDNHGRWDDHLPPGDGAIDWADIRRTLEAVDFDGWIMLELACPGDDLETHLVRAVQRARALFQ